MVDSPCSSNGEASASHAKRDGTPSSHSLDGAAAAAAAADDDDDDDDERGYSFRERRLTYTKRHLEAAAAAAAAVASLEASSSSDDDSPKKKSLGVKRKEASSSSTSAAVEPAATKRARREKAAKASTLQKIESRILHAGEIDGDVVSSQTNGEEGAHKQSIENAHWKKQRHVQDENSLPFPQDIVGTYSCHGVEPLYEDDVLEDEQAAEEEEEEPSMVAKINQDRGGMAFPYGNCGRTALFAAYDGHGEGGELVSQYALHEIQDRLHRHETFQTDIDRAMKETFIAVDEDLKKEPDIDPLYAGATACVVLLRNNILIVANSGDSRAVLAVHSKDTLEAKDLSVDQNPDSPGEMDRIVQAGGYVSLPPEPGLSARVWLDEDCTQIGLAMSRSIGDHAVSPVGVIAEPVITQHTLTEQDEFLIIATDGVWEFISSQDAVDLVSAQLKTGVGASKACQALIEAAAERWHDVEGYYRDDITALVIRLQDIWSHAPPEASTKPAEEKN